MLSHEENEKLCRVGPGTPMGELLRRFWIPICPSKDLAEPDSDPVQIRRLGEDFVAFRDSEGKLGVLDERCFHRGASLSFGRVEDGGIRCVYHGWKYAVDGTIMDTPNMRQENFKKKFKALAYPVYEAGGVVFAYFGRKEHQPPPPKFKWMEGPDEWRYVFEMIQENCNWVQAVEGGLDSSHVGILHGDEVELITKGEYDPKGIGKDRYPSVDQAPRLEVEDTTFGFHYVALREALEPGKYYARITPYVMPFMTFPAFASAVMRVPRDDESTAVISVAWDPEDHPDEATIMDRQGMDDPRVYGPDKRLRILPQDRDAMRRGESFSGIRGFNPQDGAMTMNMGGPIFDRTKEHVVPADMAVLRMRRLLLRCADAVVNGETPPQLDPAVDASEVVGTSGVIDVDEDWRKLVPAHKAL